MEKLAFDIGNTFFGGQHFLQDLPGLGQLVSILLSNAIVVAGVLFLILVIFAGITMLSASGDPQKFEQGGKIITAAVVGFILVVAAYLIVRLIERSLSINILG